jgi:sec-independent protein translocase protein TatB
MFDFGFSEIVLTSAIALIVLGPEKLPKVARQVGNWMGRARSMARQLTEQLEREVNAEDLLKQSRTNSTTSSGTTHSGSMDGGISSAAVPFDTSYTPPANTSFTPSGNVAPASSPMQAAPDPTYSATPASPPHGADWHAAPPENKSSDG